MNYLAHGYRFLDDPLFLAGTAVPDWLSVADRRVRARKRLVTPVVAASSDQSVQQIGNGILQHHSDDDAFHQCEAFLMLSSELSTKFRAIMPDPYDHRPGFLGHIVTELMLDAVLSERSPELTEQYYHALRQVDAGLIQDVVNQMASRSTDRLALFIGRFIDEQFLFDYLNDDKMLVRLNQVLRRVKLPQMNESALDVLASGRSLLRQHADSLLAAVAEQSGEAN